MNRRLLTILLTAFVIACVCTFFVAKMVGNMAIAAKQPAGTRVVAASQDLKLGTVIQKNDLTTVELGGAVPKGAILKPEDVIGRGVISDIYQGEPILDIRLAPVGSGGGLAATIPQGMRACAVKVDEVVGVSGFATPGMRVDVLVSGTPPDEQNNRNNDDGSKVKTLLQNIGVLSAGTDIQKDAQGKPQQVQVVNLLVTPEQAEILSLASSQEKIQLVLRNPLDTQIAAPPGTVVKNLFADKNSAPVKHSAPVHKAESTAFTVEIYNGSQRSDQKFATPGGKQ